MIDTLNVIAVILTIGFGLIGWLMPDYTMDKLKLATAGGSTLGKSEIRAASGALFVGLGVGALALGTPAAYAMVGFAYAGGAIGRITSIVLDGSGETVSWSFFAAEAALALYLIVANL